MCVFWCFVFLIATWGNEFGGSAPHHKAVLGRAGTWIGTVWFWMLALAFLAMSLGKSSTRAGLNLGFCIWKMEIKITLALSTFETKY